MSEQFNCRKLSAFGPCGFLVTFRALDFATDTVDLISRMNETKEKILDTAERLIGEQGYAGRCHHRHHRRDLRNARGNSSIMKL